MAPLKRTRRMSRTSRKKSRTSSLSQLQQSQTARIAKRVVMRNSETKRFNYHWNESEQNTATLDAQEMTLIAQGDEISQRTGRQILAQGINVKGCIHNNSNLEPVVVKMWVLQAKPGNTTDIDTSTAMFVKARHDTAVSFASLGGLMSTVYDIDTEQFTLLGQKRFVLDASPYPDTQVDDMAAHGGKGAIRFFSKYIPLKGRKINYDGSPGTSCQNKIWIVWTAIQADNDQIVGTKIEKTVIANLNFKDF